MSGEKFVCIYLKVKYYDKMEPILINGLVEGGKAKKLQNVQPGDKQYGGQAIIPELTALLAK